MILLFLHGEKTMPFATFFNFQGSCVISQGQLLCKYLLTHSLIQASCCWELVFIYCLTSGFAYQFESLLWKKEILFVWPTTQIGSLQFHSWSSTCFMEKCFQDYVNLYLKKVLSIQEIGDSSAYHKNFLSENFLF